MSYVSNMNMTNNNNNNNNNNINNMNISTPTKNTTTNLNLTTTNNHTNNTPTPNPIANTPGYLLKRKDFVTTDKDARTHPNRTYFFKSYDLESVIQTCTKKLNVSICYGTC